MSFLIPPPPPCKLSVLPRHSTVTWPGHELGPLYLESSRLTVWCHFVFHWHKAGAHFICLWFINVSHNTGCNCFTLQLQFLFELPSRLNKCVEMKQYGLAVRYYEFCMQIQVTVFSDKSVVDVHINFLIFCSHFLFFFLYHRYYTKARDVLYHYSHMPSFHGIHQDCDEIVKQLIVQLREQLRNPKVMFSDLVEWNPCLLLFFSSTFMDVSFDGSRKEISRIYSESVSYVSTTIILLKFESKQC